MLYTNLYREILKVYNEDTKSYHESIGTSITNTVNSASQTISDTRKANAMQDSQFKNVSELLTSKETFMAQCADILKPIIITMYQRVKQLDIFRMIQQEILYQQQLVE